MDKLVIVIPAYNEEANIEKVVREWHDVALKYGNDSRLVVINDGSRDNTLGILWKLEAELKRLIVLTKPNGGHGSTLIYGYKYALSIGADYVFQTDSDGQTLASEFGPFWAIREHYKMVIGHRAGRQDGISRVFVTQTLKAFLLLMFGERIKDANTPYRLMQARILPKCLELFDDDYNLPNVIISVACKKFNYSVKYRRITFRPRQGGVNSINLKKITIIGIKALKDFASINKKFKSMEA
ncbi:MAG: glycosyltransferase family 2 protein [Clostridiales bacterium]|nr:glycosyltransferase family 2 protein [Clostridiales bacterium]